MKLQKAAMFGLDARIALAIFGALSVISGAALYSAIQEARVTALLTEMQEIGKANESYLLDTGEYIGSDSTASNLTTDDLINDSGVDGWAGPYLSYPEGSTANVTLDHSIYGSIQVIRAKSPTWVDFTGTNYRCMKADANDCSVAVLISGVDAGILKKLEIKVDGTTTPGTEDFTGKFRYTTTGVAILLVMPYDKAQAYS